MGSARFKETRSSVVRALLARPVGSVSHRQGWLRHVTRLVPARAHATVHRAWGVKEAYVDCSTRRSSAVKRRAAPLVSDVSLR